MSIRKHCSYKGCDSDRSRENVTFFQFPREESRYNLWMKLSACENKDAPVKYLCSKHFDERKYISRNPRRLLLLASAVPYQYVSDNEESEENNEAEVLVSKSDDEDFIIQNMTVTDINDDTPFTYAESTINELEYLKEQAVSKPAQMEPKKRKWNHDVESVRKFKIQESEELGHYADKDEITTSKNDVSEEAQLIEIEEIGGAIEDPNITTFIFKGEEYIQMPKRIYIQERNVLVDSMQYYKDIVTKIKSQIEDVKL